MKTPRTGNVASRPSALIVPRRHAAGLSLLSTGGVGSPVAASAARGPATTFLALSQAAMSSAFPPNRYRLSPSSMSTSCTNRLAHGARDRLREGSDRRLESHDARRSGPKSVLRTGRYPERAARSNTPSILRYGSCRIASRTASGARSIRCRIAARSAAPSSGESASISARCPSSHTCRGFFCSCAIQAASR